MNDPKITERMPLVNLDQATERAQRMLDGMTFNREQLGQDSLAMIRELKYWRERNIDVVLKAV